MKSPQRKIIATAKRDLRAVGVRASVLEGISVRMIKFDPDTLGTACETLISISSKLRGVALYRVFLHEVGHVLGAGHVRRARGRGRHIMAPREPEHSNFRQPTKKQRRAWVLQLLVAVHKNAMRRLRREWSPE